MTNLHFVRHGFSLGNLAPFTKKPINYDLLDEYCPLEKEHGIDQVKEDGEYFKEKLRGKRVLFYVSPYYRTKQTLHYILEALPEDTVVEVREDKNIREINQGLQYQTPKRIFPDAPKPDDVDFEKKQEEYEKKVAAFQNLPEIEQEIGYNQTFQRYYSKQHGVSAEYIGYLQGDSLSEVRNRARVFAKGLRDELASGKYDDIVVVSHNTIISVLYKWITSRELERKLFTGSIISFENGEENYFDPKASVPQDQVFDKSLYENYNTLLEFQRLLSIDTKRQDLSRVFGERKINMPLEEDCQFIQKPGEMLIIPDSSKVDPDREIYFVDTTFGQDKITYDRECTSMYYVLDGDGDFYYRGLDEEEFKTQHVSTESGKNFITIPPNTVFYYESNPDNPLKLIEVMKPSFRGTVEELGDTPLAKANAAKAK